MLRYTLLMALVLPIMLSAQNCEYREQGADEFTGDKILKTEWQTLVSHVGLLKNIAFHLSVVEINDEEFVEIMYQLKQDGKVSMNCSQKESKLMFKLANGKAVTLEYGENDFYTYADRKVKYNKGKSSWIHKLTCKFRLTPEVKSILAQHQIEKVRIVLSKENLEFEIPEKVKNSILGFSYQGVKPKHFTPRAYFAKALECID